MFLALCNAYRKRIVWSSIKVTDFTSVAQLTCYWAWTHGFGVTWFLEFTGFLLLLDKCEEVLVSSLFFFPVAHQSILSTYEHFQSETYSIINVPHLNAIVHFRHWEVDGSNCSFSVRTIDWWTPLTIDLMCGVCWVHMGHTHIPLECIVLNHHNHVASLLAFWNSLSLPIQHKLIFMHTCVIFQICA